MDLRQIRYFVTLFNEGSVTKAAKRLGVVQPALSMQIRKLEEEFHTQLFQRTARGVEPTAGAREFHKHCLAILAGVEGAGQALREAGTLVTGHVTLGLMPSLAAGTMAPALLAYARDYPAVRVTVIEAYSDDLLERLQAGSLDLAIVNGGPSLPVPAIPLSMDRLALVTRVEAGEPRLPPQVTAAELGGFRLVLPSPRQGMRRLLDQRLGEAGLALQPDFEIDSLNMTLDLVSRSAYATILPELAVRKAVEAGIVHCRLITDPVIQREVVAASHRHRPPGLAVRLLVHALKAAMVEGGAGLAP